MDRKTVDIIIPIYNTPAFLLEHCFSSITKQTYKDINVIVIDDGSSNKDTLAVIEEYKSRFNVNLFHTKNSGVSEARNYGLDKSRGDYVLFLDSDDYIDPDYVENLVTCAQKHKAKIVFTGKINTDTNENDMPFRNHKLNLKSDSTKIIIKSNAFTSQAALIEQKIAKSAIFDKKCSMGEDTKYIMELFGKAENDIYITGDGGYYYVKHSENATKRASSSQAISDFLSNAIDLTVLFEKVLKPNEADLIIFKDLKLCRASKKLIKTCNGKQAFVDTCEQYKKQANLNKIRNTIIISNKLLSFGEKIRILLINHGSFRLLYLFNCLKAGRQK